MQRIGPTATGHNIIIGLMVNGFLSHVLHRISLSDARGAAKPGFSLPAMGMVTTHATIPSIEVHKNVEKKI